MTRTNKKFLLGGIAAVALIAATATAATYMTRESLDEPKAQARVTHSQPMRVAANQPVQQKPACDDGNVIGTVGGAVVGGAVGNQFGSGSGKTVATIGGAAAGAYLGNQYLPTRNATCN